jgi:copper chaperone
MSSVASDCSTSTSSDMPWRSMGLIRALTGRAGHDACCSEEPTSSRPRNYVRSVTSTLLEELVRHGPTIVDRLVRSHATRSQQREERSTAMDSTYSTPLPVLVPATGGCGCCSPTARVPSSPITTAQEDTMSITVSYAAEGLTCGHCVGAVTEEIFALPGVTGVSVDLVAGGTSTLTVTSDGPVPNDVLAAALDEAGDYRLISN